MDYKNSKAPKNTVTRDINQLTEPVGNVYETVVIIAKRANQISTGIKRELDAKLTHWMRRLRTKSKSRSAVSTSVCRNRR